MSQEVSKFEIEKENKRLLEKIASIINNKRYNSKDAKVHFSGKKQGLSPATLLPALNQPKRSLNIHIRKEESKRIATENRMIL